MTIVDPCPSATINLISAPWPLSDQQADITHSSSVSWTADTMYTISISVDCGTVAVTFEQKSSTDPASSYGNLNSALFTVD